MMATANPSNYDNGADDHMHTPWKEEYLPIILNQQQQQLPSGSSADNSLQDIENRLAREPYAVSIWWNYLDSVDDRILEFEREIQEQKRLQQNRKTAATAATDSKDDANMRSLLVRIQSNRRLRDWIGQRAVKALPRSYKLWKRHWEFVLENTKNNCGDNDPLSTCKTVLSVVAMFETAVITLHAYPRVWMVYLEWLLEQQQQQETDVVGVGFANAVLDVTAFRRTLDSALQALPVTQHEKIWSTVVQKLMSQGNEDSTEAEFKTIQTRMPLETRIRLLQRYSQFNPAAREEFANFLVDHGKWGLAAAEYQAVINDRNTTSRGASSDATEAWQAFVDLCTKHSLEIEKAGIPWEAIFRNMIEKHTTRNKKKKKQDLLLVKEDTADIESSNNSSGVQIMQGLLWSNLAAAWVRRGEFSLARSVYEEGMHCQTTVRDFQVLYDAYLQFEEGLLQACTASFESEEGTDEEEEEHNLGDQNNEEDDWDILLDSTSSNGTTSTGSKLADMELALARAEHLTAKRPLLLNQVMLRQNPDNVGEWLRRAELFMELPQAGQAAAALETALQTVNAGKAINGSPAKLVLELVHLYHDAIKDVDKARELLDRICLQREYAFSKADDLADCWAAWIELELGQEKWDEALSLSRQAVSTPPQHVVAGSHRNGGRRSINLTKSLRLWDLLLDLEESLGTVQTTKDAYNRAIEIKAATVKHILHYAEFLTDQKYFEESFTAYERGIELFDWPHAGAAVLWKAYLTSFLKRYEGTKVERTRDLFARCLETCPPEEKAIAEFYIMNGEFEEKHGLTTRALSVYSDMCKTITTPPDAALQAYQLFIAKTAQYKGVTATREIYQAAVEGGLKDAVSTANLCMEFATQEMQLQEVDRARVVYTYGAAMANPKRLPNYWKQWNEFEIAHGNEETFREMLRVKRSVEAAFSTINYNMPETAKQETLTDAQAMDMIARAEGVDLSKHAASGKQTTALAGFVASTHKRTAAVANLEDVEDRVAKLRRATGAESATMDHRADDGADDDEIDIDDIDNEIEEAAAEGAAAVAVAPSQVQDVTTKAIPNAVFGGLSAKTVRS